MLKETVIKALQERFGNTVLLPDKSDDFASFPAKHPEVGDVTVQEDHGELIVFIGSITHGHFGHYEKDLSDDEHARVIAEDLVAFLADLFDDKYLLHKSRWGGGWTRADLVKESDMQSPKVKWFKWSGPITPDTLGN